MGKTCRIILAAVVFLVVCLKIAVTTMNAMQHIVIFIDEKQIVCDYTIVNDRIYIPLRQFAETMGAEVIWDEENHVVNVKNNIKFAASIPEEGIYMYTFNEENNCFKNVIVSFNGTSKVFEWDGLQAMYVSPQLYYIGSYHGNNKTLAIILTKDRGTGVCRQDIHLINMENFFEYIIDDPQAVIVDNAVMTVTTPSEVEVKIGNDIVIVDIAKVPFEYSALYPDEITTIYSGNHVSYEFIEATNTIIATTVVEASPLKYIGNFSVFYSFIDGQYIASRIEFSSPVITVDKLSKTLRD